MTASLSRRLGVTDSVVIGLGAMLGAGVFVAIGPAAQAAGAGLLLGLLVAAVVAYCNADASARLAARYPSSGGTYVYGRERLGPLWGYLAGWCFVVGKTASCAAIAVTFGSYVAPAHPHLVAMAAAAVVTGLNLAGLQKSLWATRAIVTAVLAVLACVVFAVADGGAARSAHLHPFPGTSAHGVLQAAALIFFAFAGYARIATLGEEVRDPARTIRRAIPVALGITVVTYAVVFTAALLAVGPHALAASSAPLRAAVEAGSRHALAPLVRVGAAVATFGSLLALVLGVSRTMLAMARDRHLPRGLATVRHDVPQAAEAAVGIVVVVLAGTLDLRNAIGFSSFGVLLYYAVANASAWTLGRRRRVLTVIGLVGCVTMAVNLPIADLLTGLGVLAVGALAYAARAARAARRPSPAAPPPDGKAAPAVESRPHRSTQ